MAHKDPEKRREYFRQYYREHRDQCNEYTRLYRKRHPKRVRQRNQEYSLKHPEYQREYYQKNRVRVLARMAALHVRRREWILAKYGGRCACCGSPYDLEIDHIVPWDGTTPRRGNNLVKWIVNNNFPDMFQLLCSNCNTAKGRGKECPIDHNMAVDPEAP
jgi:5-methylcytosine-specific restriction endonuclease McrA